jgi:hypothetical protein
MHKDPVWQMSQVLFLLYITQVYVNRWQKHSLLKIPSLSCITQFLQNQPKISQMPESKKSLIIGLLTVANILFFLTFTHNLKQ